MKLFDVACELSQIMQVKFVVLYRQITVILTVYHLYDTTAVTPSLSAARWFV